MQVAWSADTCRGQLGKVSGGSAGDLSWLAGIGPDRHLLVLFERMEEAGPSRSQHSSTELPCLLPQHKHDWEYFRTGRARKTNPGIPDKECAKANFHVTSRNHMFIKPPADLQLSGEVQCYCV